MTSYASTSNAGIQKSLEVELDGETMWHRFTALDPDTYYTFTIIVIMGSENAEAESESEAITVGFTAHRTYYKKIRVSNLSFLARSHMLMLQRYGSRELMLTVYILCTS